MNNIPFPSSDVGKTKEYGFKTTMISDGITQNETKEFGVGFSS